MNQKFRQRLILISLLIAPFTLLATFSQPQAHRTAPSPLPIPSSGNRFPFQPSTVASNPSPAPSATPTPPSLAPANLHLPNSATNSSHPNYPYNALLDNSSNQLYPSEPFINRLSSSAGLAAISNNTTNAPIIAVIDTGFGLNHTNLSSRWQINPSETGPTTIGSSQNCSSQNLSWDKRCNNYDNNGDGYASNWRGWDFINNDNDPSAGTTSPTSSAVTHGTLTASLAAVLNPKVKIMPLQALDDTGSGYTDTVAAAIRYAADNGANVISLSLGSTYDDAYLRSQIDYAINKGVLVVAASGNNGCDCLSYPAAYPEVLSVGAGDSSDNRASFSSYGSNLDVIAPGTAGDVCGAVWTPSDQTNSYSCSYSGTSFATPITASLTSLIKTQNPSASVSDIIRFVTQNTDKVAGMAGQDRIPQYGYGRINVFKSLLGASLAMPAGQIINKSTASLSAPDLTGGPLMNSACQGNPGASCDIRLTSFDGKTTIYLGQQTLDSNGGANFTWNAASLGLTPGQWKVESILTDQGQSTTRPATYVIINP